MHKCSGTDFGHSRIRDSCPSLVAHAIFVVDAGQCTLREAHNGCQRWAISGCGSLKPRLLHSISQGYASMMSESGRYHVKFQDLNAIASLVK
jgi:hypothetical protein